MGNGIEFYYSSYMFDSTPAIDLTVSDFMLNGYQMLQITLGNLVGYRLMVSPNLTFYETTEWYPTFFILEWFSQHHHHHPCNLITSDTRVVTISKN